MLVIPLIERKRDGQPLSPEEWSWLIREYAQDRVPDYQMAALLMAVFLNGLSPAELAALTDAMTASGRRLQFAAGLGPRIDKHSTGGVGDKVSLVLAPLVASCGVLVPMMSGRGLGHTGGTLDKLEAIPGFRTSLPLDQAQRQVERIGCAMIGQTDEIAPADRKLYALRDATATIEVIPLMAASIMSKKLAEGLNGLVLDVKRGSGAFLPDLDAGLDLARTMISLGHERGCETVALLTAMDRPLGRACGNALETREAIAALGGNGPEDVMQVVLALGAEMLLLAGIDRTRPAATERLLEAVRSGRARDKFGEVIEAQGGDPRVLDRGDRLPAAPRIESFEATRSGVISRIDPRTIGQAVVALGGGRQRTDSNIDVTVGFEFAGALGERVAKGQPIASVHARDDAGIRLGRAALERAVEITEGGPAGLLPLISHRVTTAGVEEVS